MGKMWVQKGSGYSWWLSCWMWLFTCETFICNFAESQSMEGFQVLVLWAQWGFITQKTQWPAPAPCSSPGPGWMVPFSKISTKSRWPKFAYSEFLWKPLTLHCKLLSWAVSHEYLLKILGLHSQPQSGAFWKENLAEALKMGRRSRPLLCSGLGDPWAGGTLPMWDLF